MKSIDARDHDLVLAVPQPTEELCRLYHGVACKRGCDLAAQRNTALARVAALEREIAQCRDDMRVEVSADAVLLEQCRRERDTALAERDEALADGVLSQRMCDALNDRDSWKAKAEAMERVRDVLSGDLSFVNGVMCKAVGRVNAAETERDAAIAQRDQAAAQERERIAAWLESGPELDAPGFNAAAAAIRANYHREGGPCGHGRDDYRMCPHCLGVNSHHLPKVPA